MAAAAVAAPSATPVSKMVYLGRVSMENDREGLPEIDELDLGVPGEDSFTASVYGSRYAALDLPKHEMPEDEMPREVAYRMIK